MHRLLSGAVPKSSLPGVLRISPSSLIKCKDATMQCLLILNCLYSFIIHSSLFFLPSFIEHHPINSSYKVIIQIPLLYWMTSNVDECSTPTIVQNMESFSNTICSCQFNCKISDLVLFHRVSSR